MKRTVWADEQVAATVNAAFVPVMIDVDDLADAHAKFTELAEAGQIIMPFSETFWADGYGFCTDRFGIMWQINCTGSKAM